MSRSEYTANVQLAGTITSNHADAYIARVKKLAAQKAWREAQAAKKASFFGKLFG